MKKTLGLLVGCAVFTALATASFANVYAAHLNRVDNGNGTFNLNYRLNENADTGVTVRVKGPAPSTAVVRTINAGVQVKGAQSVVWDGKDDGAANVAAGSYSWEVTAADDGYSTFTLISDNAANTTQYYTPYGCAVDTNLASPYFGMVYVVNGIVGTTAAAPGRTVGDGVYVLSNDLADITAQGDTAYAGGVTWGGSSSPFRARVDEAGTLFITDWSDAHSGIWTMDPANPAANFNELLDNTGREASGLVPGLHGSIAGCWIKGVDAGRELFTIDEDLQPADPSRGSIYKYAIGTATAGYNTPPVLEYPDAANGDLEQNYNSCIAPGNNGWWISQYRSAETSTVPSLIHYNTGSATVDFNSASNIPGVLTASNQGAMCVNPAGTRLVYAGNNFVRVLDISAFPTVTVEYQATSADATYSGTTSRDAAFDAAGNVYATNSSAELLRVYSPGGGANQYTTPAAAGQSLTVVAGVNKWIEY